MKTFGVAHPIEHPRRFHRVDLSIQTARKTGLALFVAMVLGLTVPAELQSETFCIDYEYFPNTANLQVYDFTILSPYCQVNLGPGHALGKKFYAYISAGEVARSAQYFAAAQQAGIPFLAENPNWSSMVVDLSSPLWAPFVIEQLARPAVAQGYDGFFLDTMDSYYLAPSSLEAAQESGLVSLVQRLKAAFPSKKIIINRGFPVFSRLQNSIDGLLVEGLFYTWPGQRQSAGGTSWLIQQLAPVQSAGKPIYIVDYLPLSQAALASQVAAQIGQLGFNPLVVGPELNGTVLAPQPGQSASSSGNGSTVSGANPPGSSMVSEPSYKRRAVKTVKIRSKTTNPIMGFTRRAGTLYLIEYRDPASGFPWQIYREFPAESATQWFTVSVAPPQVGTTRLYRLILLKPI